MPFRSASIIRRFGASSKPDGKRIDNTREYDIVGPLSTCFMFTETGSNGESDLPGLGSDDGVSDYDELADDTPLDPAAIMEEIAVLVFGRQ